MMMYLSDLHTHSTASDGQYSPSELVELAKKRGIALLALTDHDTLSGLPEAIAAGKSAGIKILPGIELSAKEYPTFHILGYGFSPDAPTLRALCGRMRERRDRRGERIVEFLREKGVEISLDEVRELAGTAALGRPHFAQVIVRHGYAKTNREVFDCWLDTDEYRQRVEQGKPSVTECICAIKADGGKVSLAHPYQIGLEEDALETLVRDLKEMGLDAIECFYPKHSPAQTTFYLHLAEKYGLYITGGSDFHGERVKPEVSLNAWPLELEWLMEQQT